ncbi:hypothetical protein SBADM41S_06313 [Streptomyces badius]
MPNSAPSYSTRSKTASDSNASKGSWSSVSSSSSFSASARSLSSSEKGFSSSLPFFGLSRTWSRSTSISLAKSRSIGMVGRKTDAVSPRRRERTNRPTAWAKKRGVEMVVAYTPTARRGTSTPSDTIRTATIQRDSSALNRSIFLDAAFSSERTTVADSPVTFFRILAYARAESWSVAMTSPPASGMPLRTSVSRLSAAARTLGIHSPVGASAVRQAWPMASLVIGSPSRAAISSPAFVRQRMLPL